MKRYSKFLMIIVFTLPLFLASCDQKGDPAVVLKNFFEKLNQKDIDGAAKLATKDSKPILDMMKKAAQDSKDSTGSKDNMNNLEFGKAIIENETAKVPVTNKSDNSTVEFNLKKEEGEWKVEFTMEALMKMGENAMKESEQE